MTAPSDVPFTVNKITTSQNASEVPLDIDHLNDQLQAAEEELEDSSLEDSFTESSFPSDYDSAEAEEASSEYIGLWNMLVSTTNWEKGRLISQWRTSMQHSHAPSHMYSDETWSRRVGNVTGQHVGRLRRVYERFGSKYQTFSGLFWSHFQAVLDWEDAEVWLEGAVQNHWSVAQMRASRWVALGAAPELKPLDADITLAELDEDVTPINDAATLSGDNGKADIGKCPKKKKDKNEEDDAHSPSELNEFTGNTFSNPDSDILDVDNMENITLSPDETEKNMRESLTPIRPFADLPKMPQDMEDAFDLFKLAILNHKLAQWREISCADTLAVLESLKILATTKED